MLKAKVLSTLGPRIVSKHQNGSAYINISSESKQELGRILHPAWKHPFTHPIYGNFNCLEGFRWFLASGCLKQNLREKYGHEMAIFGRSSKRLPYQEELKSLIEAFGYQLEQNPKLREALEMIKANHAKDIPVTYFHVYGNAVKDMNVIATPMVKVILEYLDSTENASVE